MQRRHTQPQTLENSITIGFETEIHGTYRQEDGRYRVKVLLAQPSLEIY